VSIDTLKLLYFSHVQSHILYALVIWGGSRHLEQVFVAQKRAVRALEGINYWGSYEALDSCKPLFKKHNIPTVYSLYILECIKYFVNNRSLFQKYCDTVDNRLVTRNNMKNSCPNDLVIKDCSLMRSTENPEYMIARVFNSLPIQLKMIEDGQDLIKCVKVFVMEHQFYDLSEYYRLNN
jgi:hypothetical protein